MILSSDGLIVFWNLLVVPDMMLMMFTLKLFIHIACTLIAQPDNPANLMR